MDQVLEAKPDSSDGDLGEFAPRTVVLDLDCDAAKLMDELIARTGWDGSELVGWALGALWREFEGIPLEPFQPMSDEELQAMMREAEEDIRAGRLIPHEEVMAEARKIVGG